MWHLTHLKVHWIFKKKARGRGVGMLRSMKIYEYTSNLIR